MSHRKRNRRGSILVLSLLVLVLLFFVTAMVVDIGSMELTKTKLQAAADAAALAAAGELGDPAEVRRVAKEYAGYHKLDGNPIAITDAQIEIGEWDQQSSSFTKSPDDKGSVVRILTPSLGRNTFFAGMFGHKTYDRTGEAIASTRPRDIIFVVDQSGSMNDDTESAWATKSIESKFEGTPYAGVGESIIQDFYTDMGFGSYPGTLEYMGAPLGVPANKTAYAKMTENGGPLSASTMPATYRILDGDNEQTRRRKSYSWMMDYQIKSLLPAARPIPDSSTNYDYWQKYIDYVVDVEYVSNVPYTPSGGGSSGGGSTGPTPPSPGYGFQLRDLSKYAFLFGSGMHMTGWSEPAHRGWIPPSVDGDRIYRFNNPNKSAYPSGDSSTRWQLRNKFGYQTYSQFLLDYGRDERPEGSTYVQSSINSTHCPFHDESINGETFQFPPRTQPMNAVRRSLISSLQVIRDRNKEFGMTIGRDYVAVMAFDKAGNGTTLVHALTDDYEAAMTACTTLQSTSDKGRSTATEVGLSDAYNYIRPTDKGGFGRRNANKVVVLLTDGLPNDYTSADGDIDSYMAASPGETDFYGGGYYWLDAALMQTRKMQAEKWFVYPIGIGFGTDYDFMDRVARMGDTATGGQAMRGTGNPALYEETLKEMFLEIITNAAVGLVK